MKQANEPYKSMFITYVKPLMEELLKYPFGHIVTYKLQTSFPQLNKSKKNLNCGIPTCQVNKLVHMDNNTKHTVNLNIRYN